MRGEQLPERDHVAHYCRPGSLDPETGEATGASFHLRRASQTKAAESYLSLFWLEKIGAGSVAGLVDALKRYIKNPPRVEIKPRDNGAYAAVNVHELLRILETEYPARTWAVVHEPRGEPPDESDPHSGLYGLSLDYESEEIAEVIAAHVATFPAR